jgi:hypothetical protein
MKQTNIYGNRWSAVTKGAMLRALQGDIVETRIIRFYYGISHGTPWVPEIHESGKYKRTAAKNKYEAAIFLQCRLLIYA